MKPSDASDTKVDQDTHGNTIADQDALVTPIRCSRARQDHARDTNAKQVACTSRMSDLCIAGANAAVGVWRRARNGGGVQCIVAVLDDLRRGVPVAAEPHSDSPRRRAAGFDLSAQKQW